MPPLSPPGSVSKEMNIACVIWPMTVVTGTVGEQGAQGDIAKAMWTIAGQGVFKDGCSGSIVFLASGCRMASSHPWRNPVLILCTQVDSAF